MPHIQIETLIKASLEACFDLSRDVSVHTESTGGERAVAGVTSGLLEAGDEVTFEAKHFGFSWRLTSKITDFDRPHRFIDEMQRGPFKRWHHVHKFISTWEGTKMVDEVSYFPPLWPLSWIVNAIFLEQVMRKLLTKRIDFIRRLAEERHVDRHIS